MGDLSSMASGLSWDEKYYSPFSIVTRAYFDDNLKEIILGLEINEKPGQSFKYLSGATQLLAMCIEKSHWRTFIRLCFETFLATNGSRKRSFMAIRQKHLME